ncbi:hypothetical protein JL09_g2110 [Pichia kudriavzevii]|uniref:CAF1B/HIR1 beta-propeller domain-containing protein n=1 Tax=Pichia kudriavzevii TaxID=4909 RepID=A0A099P0W0_PICKU|nr:hypothetical protein JL09_g2110 [Pichia kudriavzevii]
MGIVVTAKTLALHWHDGANAIYSISAQPLKDGESLRIATGGGDNNIRIWRLLTNSNGEVDGVKYLSNISKHDRAVNCVRFNSQGDLLASGSDDGSVLLFCRSEEIVREFGDDEDEILESWVLVGGHRGSAGMSMKEVYDIAWSPDARLLCLGTMDGTVGVVDASSGALVSTVRAHAQNVQGVSWDPLGEYIVSLGGDRCINIMTFSMGILKSISKSCKIFYGENLETLFRRLTWSPQGSLLVAPCGIINNGANTTNGGTITTAENAVYIFTRASLTTPVAVVAANAFFERDTSTNTEPQARSVAHGQGEGLDQTQAHAPPLGDNETFEEKKRKLIAVNRAKLASKSGIAQEELGKSRGGLGEQLKRMFGLGKKKAHSRGGSVDSSSKKLFTFGKPDGSLNDSKAKRASAETAVPDADVAGHGVTGLGLEPTVVPGVEMPTIVENGGLRDGDGDGYANGGEEAGLNKSLRGASVGDSVEPEEFTDALSSLDVPVEKMVVNAREGAGNVETSVTGKGREDASRVEKEEGGKVKRNNRFMKFFNL